METNILGKAVTYPQKAVRKAQRIFTHTTEDTYRWIFKRSSWSTVINEHEIRIVGMRRTGNHAVFEWIKAQAEGEIQSLNNLEVNVNPYRYKYEKLRDYYPQHKWVMGKLKPPAKGNFSQRDWLFYSYEDHDLEKIGSPFFEFMHDLYLGKSRKRIDLLVLRDPFNLFASRLKSEMVPIKNPQKNAVQLWTEYAQEFLDETQKLTQKKVCVNYNRWFQDRDYREQIAQLLDIPFTDAGINNVSGCGGGSSFEQRNYVGKAQEMPVLERWKQYADHPAYLSMFRNNEQLFHYSEKIFGPIPGTEQLFQGKY
jgi:hypothetical protein